MSEMVIALSMNAQTTSESVSIKAAAFNYDLSGRQLSAPQRGANIVVEYGNGQVRRRVLMRNEK